MKTTDIPKTDSNIWYLTNQCRMDDARSTQSELRYADEAEAAYLNPIGVCRLMSTDSNGRNFEIPVCVNDVFFRKKGYLDWSDVPLAFVFSIVGEEGVYIYINTVAYQLYFNEFSRVVIIGLLAHEMGHAIAGDCDRSTEPVFELHDGDVVDIVTQLLQGRSLTSEMEHRATDYAIRLVGIGPVLAMLNYFAQRSDHIGLRMEVANQISRIIGKLGPDYVPPKLDYKDFEASIYTEEEMAVRRARYAEQMNTASSDKGSL